MRDVIVLRLTTPRAQLCVLLRHNRRPVHGRRPTLGDGSGPGACSAARRNMHIHANTVYRGLESITGLFGDLWPSMDSRRAVFITVAHVSTSLSSSAPSPSDALTVTPRRNCTVKLANSR